MVAGCRGKGVDSGGLSRGQSRERSGSRGKVGRNHGRMYLKMERSGGSL